MTEDQDRFADPDCPGCFGGLKAPERGDWDCPVCGTQWRDIEPPDQAHDRLYRVLPLIDAGIYGTADSAPRNLFAERRRLGFVPRTLPGERMRGL